MRKHRVVNSLALAGALLAPQSFASTQGLSLNFTAVIEETTCLMKVSSLNNSSLSGSDTQYALTIPNIGIAELLNVTANTEGSFKLQPQECNNNIASITMTLKGTTLSNSSYRLQNNLSSGNAENVGLGFKPDGSDDSSNLKLDGTQKTDWSQSQIADGMNLSAFFRRASNALTPTPGDFQAKVTFTFTYQ
ncbi:fimbrial protein [Salmonella enterica subsp. enterica serovar Ajiobo]|nr:fimbrial protein [Salmonella enterica subsp. enterica serovar Ajiobo]EHX8705025.1 fimbrial protein [Salmonella enterica subsp. enterica serovar Ajiobo]EIC3755805.1 fimbrial protein [Salmonella enterica subsp. enterica serovar Ajiobo]EII7080302.1 fimbrial protein [Salmonella enterica subsp. enterica serovar Ajiobo]EKF5618567.1 fimbrial protein [Salmonella enterica subsp. enterica]